MVFAGVPRLTGIWLDKKFTIHLKNYLGLCLLKYMHALWNLYLVLQLSPRRLVYELEMLGYSSVEKVLHPGEFSQNGEEVEYYARGYKFWDSVEDSPKIKVLFLDPRLNKSGLWIAVKVLI